MGNCCMSARGSESPNKETDLQPPEEANEEANVMRKESLTSSNTTSSAPSTLTFASYSEKKQVSEDLAAPGTSSEIVLSSNLKDFTFSELKVSTRNFRMENLIGEGGFGFVYKGWVDEESLSPSKPGSGMVVAIKKLKEESFQGHKEWLTEVNYLGQLHHPNLVKLIGYCSDGDNRLLVYEFMTKGSLENHLFRRSSEPLSWLTRINLAVGAARGLAFLHDRESQIIYRDVKSSNILIDSEFNAKLSDFGLAKDGPRGDRTHVSTQVVGTHGYAAPEYIATGRLTAKADIYSFGVVLLELLTGRRALDKTRVGIEQSLVDWVRPRLGDKRKLHNIMDPRMEGQYPRKDAHSLATHALRCIGNDAKSRPTMSELLAALEKLKDSKEAIRARRRDQHGKSRELTVRPRARSLPSPLHPAATSTPSPLSPGPRSLPIQ